MPFLNYYYASLPGFPPLCPVVPGILVNTQNGKTTEIIGILDTGADRTTLSKRFLSDLGIDPATLPEKDIGGVQQIVKALFCDFIKIGFLEFPNYKKHFPNGTKPVPLYFAEGPFNLLGRNDFLNLCRVTFDGPKLAIYVDIP